MPSPVILVILVLLLLIAALCFAIWLREARILVALFQKAFFPGRKGPAFYNNKHELFPQAALLEQHTNLIREEYLFVIGHARIPRMHHVDGANHRISFDEGPAWKTILLKGFDGWFEPNCALFPATTALLKQMPSVSSAMFSILEPGARIPPHTGKFNGILRYHLALAVPQKGHCFILVNGEAYSWKKDEGVLFNDVYQHAVTNDSREYRVVLFIDVKKKAPALVAAINDLLYRIVHTSPGFRRALKLGTINLD